MPFGLEPLPATAVYARSKFGLNIITDTLRETTYPPEYFDVITSFQVFEHLPSPEEDIKKLRRFLKKDGLILIEVPNYNTWSMKILRSHHRHFVGDHVNFYSKETLQLFLENNGFKVIKHYHPTRRMSVRHLTKRWLSRYTPKPIATISHEAIKRTFLWEYIIGLNIGDIIAVIARKV